MSWVAVAGGAASLLGGILGSSASEDAARQQAEAALNAQRISQQEFNTITQQESPFMQTGYGALSQLNYLLGAGQPGTYMANGLGPGGKAGPASPGASAYAAPIASSSPAGGFGSLLTPFSLSNWEQLSPAYAFQKGQGMQGVLNADAAGQGALSGSALKDLMNYNQGLAGTSFNNAFNQYQTQQGNIFSRLSGLAQLGQNAASNTGQQGTALAGQAAQSAQNVGTALAGGTIGAANAWTGALSSAAPWLAYGGGGQPATATPSNAGSWSSNPADYGYAMPSGSAGFPG